MKNSTNNSSWRSDAGYSITTKRNEIVNSQIKPFWGLEDVYIIYILERYRLDQESWRSIKKLIKRNYEKV